MPGNVSAPDYGTPARVMPRALAAAFSESRSYDAMLNEYVDGATQAAAINSISVRRFRFTGRDQTNALRTFFMATGHLPFYFYFFAEGAHDPTGVATAGRYGVVFEGNMTEASDFVASQEIGIVEVA